MIYLVSQTHIEREDFSFLFLFRISFYFLIFYLNFFILAPRLFLKKKWLLYVVATAVVIKIAGYFKNFIFPFIFDLFDVQNVDHGPVELLTVTFLVIGLLAVLIERFIQVEKNKKEIELKFLKSQLNPHFLFNSLNSIYSLSTIKSDDAPEAILKLSDLMRYMLEESSEEKVLLSKELNFISNYFDLQSLRIGDNTHVTLDINGGVSSQKIAPLLLISYIENAFKFGTDKNGHTYIKISISVADNILAFKCENVIGEAPFSSKKVGIGIKNTKKRLNLLYADKHSLLVETKDDKFVVNLNLNLA